MRNKLTRTISIGLVLAATACLAGCGTAPRPLSVEERVWFDKATGYEFPTHPGLVPYRYGSPPFHPPPPLWHRG